jgi:hypothetical protein
MKRNFEKKNIISIQYGIMIPRPSTGDNNELKLENFLALSE